MAPVRFGHGVSLIRAVPSVWRFLWGKGVFCAFQYSLVRFLGNRFRFRFLEKRFRLLQFPVPGGFLRHTEFFLVKRFIAISSCKGSCKAQEWDGDSMKLKSSARSAETISHPQSPLSLEGLFPQRKSLFPH